MDDAPVALTGSAQATRLTANWEFILRQARAHGTLLKFMLVGLVGYFLYTGSLFIVYDLPFPFMPDKHTSARLWFITHDDLRLLIGTLMAAQVSITGGFFARDLWVFGDSAVIRKPAWQRFLQFQAKSLVSTLAILSVTVNVLTGGFGLAHYVSTPIGIAIAFVWNWLWESQFIWRKASPG
ncbi:MAG TPA: GtrA family protein [Anaerolineales bacterium]|nr:GtrA family protein [Anaerolineales bacterium]